MSNTRDNRKGSHRTGNAKNDAQPSRMGKIMDMIYANSQCASVYFQMFDMNNIRQGSSPFMINSDSPTRK